MHQAQGFEHETAFFEEAEQSRAEQSRAEQSHASIGILSSSGCCNTMMVAMACTYGLGGDGIDDVE